MDADAVEYYSYNTGTYYDLLTQQLTSKVKQEIMVGFR